MTPGDRAWRGGCGQLARLEPRATGHIAIGSRERLEQLALACTLARQAGVPCPAVQVFGQMPGEILVLLTTVPSGAPLGGAVTAGEAASLFASLRTLHNAGIAHRDLRAENLFVSEKSAGFRSLDASVAAASELTRRLDLAQALATLAPAVGPPAPSRPCGTGTGPSTTGPSRPSCNRSPWHPGAGGRCAPARRA